MTKIALDLSGQIACVTGSATGIGRATALALATAGAKVALNHYRQPELALQLEREIRDQSGIALSFEADVANAAEVIKMFGAIDTQFGALDILVNNAGVLLEKPFLETTEADWDRVMSIDLKSVFLCSHAALTRMAPRGSGCVINIASELAGLGRERFGVYCAAKAGVIGLTKSLAREFAPAIRINAIAPGPTDTAMLSLDQMSAEWQKKELAIPAARAGRPDEIAATVVFLASAHATFFYGQTLSPNGGAWMP
jgi:3-oxoacyl-[acyl-carrier protein] reductase